MAVRWRVRRPAGGADVAARGGQAAGAQPAAVPAGASKTTLMRILAGLLHPDDGRVTAGGHDLATKSGRQALKRELGYLPQDLGLYPDLTARQFLDYVALLKAADT